MMEYFTKRASICCGRSKQDCATPPADICGYWFANTASLEWRVGTHAGRRKHGFQQLEDKNLAWAIVDNTSKKIEWCAGTVTQGEMQVYHSYKGNMLSWGETAWQCTSAVTLLVSKAEYTTFQGHSLVMALNVNGLKLRRAFALTVEDVPLYLFLEETREHDWDTLCLEALVDEEQQDNLEREGKTGKEGNSKFMGRTISSGSNQARSIG